MLPTNSAKGQLMKYIGRRKPQLNPHVPNTRNILCIPLQRPKPPGIERISCCFSYGWRTGGRKESQGGASRESGERAASEQGEKGGFEAVVAAGTLGQSR